MFLKNPDEFVAITCQSCPLPRDHILCFLPLDFALPFPTGDDSDFEACDSECVEECGDDFGGVSRKLCGSGIIGVGREENMTSGFHIVRMKALGFAGIEKHGRGIEKNGRGIEKNGRGIEMIGRGIEMIGRMAVCG
ncbi:hypothetical protein Tco_1384659 [Tanacetum coccineum]